MVSIAAHFTGKAGQWQLNAYGQSSFSPCRSHPLNIRSLPSADFIMLKIFSVSSFIGQEPSPLSKHARHPQQKFIFFLHNDICSISSETCFCLQSGRGFFQIALQFARYFHSAYSCLLLIQFSFYKISSPKNHLIVK